MQLLSRPDQYRELFIELKKKANPQQLNDSFRALCQHDLYFLLRYAIGRADMENKWLFDRCREVQAQPDDMLDLWFREGYKSTVITFGLTIQDILNDPEITVGIFSHIRPIAKGFLLQIKRELENNQNLKVWFPDILYDDPAKQAAKWSENEGLIVKRKSNPKECTIEAWGVVDGQPTGKHFSLLIYDDVVTKESVSTPEMIAKVTESMQLSFNLGAAGGRRRFIGTRYRYNDTYKTIIDQHIATPRIKPATEDGTVSGKSVYLDPEILAQKRRDQGPYVFSCQMLQNPKADENQGFKREWLRHTDINPIGLNWYITVDAASSKKKGSDYTSHWAVGLGPDKNYYCVPLCRDRLNLTQRTRRLMDAVRLYQPLETRYEKYGLMADIEHIQQVQIQENYRFDIVEVGGTQSKEDRIKRLIPLFEQGRIYLPYSHHVTDYEGRTVDLVHEFIEQEFTAFPVSVHDDMLDSLSRICEIEGTLAGKTTAQPLTLVFPQPTNFYINMPPRESRDWRIC